MQNDYKVLAELALYYVSRNEYSNSCLAFTKYFALVERGTNTIDNPYHEYNALMYYNFGVVCNRLGKKEKALEVLKKALVNVDFTFMYTENMNGAILLTNIVKFTKDIKETL